MDQVAFFETLMQLDPFAHANGTDLSVWRTELMMMILRLSLIILTTALGGAFSAATAQPSTDPCADTKTKLTQAENRLKDWPQLGRYRDANSTLR